jgi:hypothetical protein
MAPRSFSDANERVGDWLVGFTPDMASRLFFPEQHASRTGF